MLRESARQRAVADEVAGEQDQVGRERVDPFDDAAHEEGLSELVEVDVADLGDAEVLEGAGEIGDGKAAVDDAEFVAGELAGIERQAAGGDQRGADQEAAPGKKLLLLCHRAIGDISGHSP